MFDLSIFIPTHYAGPRNYAAIMQACEFAKANKHIEVIVSDNSSDPNKLLFLQSFASENFKVAEGPFEENYLFALEQASGRYVMPMGDDDYLLPAAIPQLIERLIGSNGFIGAAGQIGRELSGGYDFYPLHGMDNAAYDKRISSLVRLIPIGNPLFHTIIEKDVLLKAFKLWFSIPNLQAYHDQIATLYVACAGPLLLMEQPYFIYNFGNWGPQARVESEIRYAKRQGMPVSILLIQRLMLAIEGYFLISSPTFSANDEQRRLAAETWFGVWMGAWRQSLLGDYLHPDVISCHSFLRIESLARKYLNTSQFSQREMLDEIAELYDAINGSGSNYRRFWLSMES